MSNRRKPRHHTDPRRIPGQIVDATDDPHARGSVVVDARHAILLDDMSVSTIDPDHGARGQESAIAMQLNGRINQTTDRASVLFVFGTDGAAAIITELMALFGRSGVDHEALFADIGQRLAKLGEEGNLSDHGDTP